MKREVVKNGVRIRISEDGVQPEGYHWNDDSRFLHNAYVNGGEVEVNFVQHRYSLQRAGLMVPCAKSNKFHSGFVMTLTKAGQRRGKQLFEEYLKTLPSRRRWFKKIRNRIIHKAPHFESSWRMFER